MRPIHWDDANWSALAAAGRKLLEPHEAARIEQEAWCASLLEQARFLDGWSQAMRDEADACAGMIQRQGRRRLHVLG